MSEQPDNTTEPDESSSLKRDQEQHGYYYDDETGYEVYDPAQDNDDEETEKAEDENDGLADSR